METIFDLLAAQPFLAGCTPAQLDKVSCWASRSVFHAGARLFEEDGRADRCWILREGHVTLDTQLSGGGPTVVETLGPGAVLGWSWLFPPYRWHFGASAVETTLAIELDGPGLRDLCERDPVLGQDLMRRFMAVVVQRLQATRLRVLDLSATPS